MATLADEFEEEKRGSNRWVWLVVIIMAIVTGGYVIAMARAEVEDNQVDRLQELQDNYLYHTKQLEEYLGEYGLTIDDLGIRKVSSAKTEKAEDFQVEEGK